MVKLKSSIKSRAYGFLGRYIHARRYDMSLPLSVSLLDQKKSNFSVPCSPLMSGHLRDISKTGLSLIVPSMRFGDRFLISGHYPLQVMVELPNRVLQIQVAPVRYDKLREEQSESRYLIGARIMQMTDADREHLTDYIQQRKSAGRRLSTSRAMPNQPEFFRRHYPVIKRKLSASVWSASLKIIFSFSSARPMK